MRFDRTSQESLCVSTPPLRLHPTFAFWGQVARDMNVLCRMTAPLQADRTAKNRRGTALRLCPICSINSFQSSKLTSVRIAPVLYHRITLGVYDYPKFIRATFCLAFCVQPVSFGSCFCYAVIHRLVIVISADAIYYPIVPHIDLPSCSQPRAAPIFFAICARCTVISSARNRHSIFLSKVRQFVLFYLSRSELSLIS